MPPLYILSGGNSIGIESGFRLSEWRGWPGGRRVRPRVAFGRVSGWFPVKLRAAAGRIQAAAVAGYNCRIYQYCSGGTLNQRRRFPSEFGQPTSTWLSCMVRALPRKRKISGTLTDCSGRGATDLRWSLRWELDRQRLPLRG